MTARGIVIKARGLAACREYTTLSREVGTVIGVVCEGAELEPRWSLPDDHVGKPVSFWQAEKKLYLWPQPDRGYALDITFATGEPSVRLPAPSPAWVAMYKHEYAAAMARRVSA